MITENFPNQINKSRRICFPNQICREKQDGWIEVDRFTTFSLLSEG